VIEEFSEKIREQAVSVGKGDFSFGQQNNLFPVFITKILIKKEIG
jgi:hypothetical protein